MLHLAFPVRLNYQPNTFFQAFELTMFTLTYVPLNICVLRYPQYGYDMTRTAFNTVFICQQDMVNKEIFYTKMAPQ